MKENMEITVFAKKRAGKDGKNFYSYLAKLLKKDGSALTVSVKFRDETGKPKPENCPMNIVVNKGDMNLSEKLYEHEDTGESAVSYTLWVSKWTEGAEYVDHSLDDFI